MKAPVRNFIIRDATGTREAETLVIGRGIPLSTTAGGLPELASLLVGETQLMPSGGDDTQAIRDALARFGGVRLGPGDFNVSGQIEVGTGQSVAGCGPDRTRILTSSAPAGLSAIFHLTGSGATVEGMNVFGNAASCVSADSATGARIRDLRLNTSQYGIKLSGVAHGEVSGVFTESVWGTGLHATGGEQLAVTGLKVDSASQGLVLSSVRGAQCTGLRLRVDQTGVTASGTALAFSSVQIEDGQYGLRIAGGLGVTVSGLQTLNVESTALEVTGSTAVALAGCCARNTEGTYLHIGSSNGVTVDGLLCDARLVLATMPYVVVDSGSMQVRLSGTHRLNPYNWPPPQYEVDVTAAGGRVVFIQHNFDPARINSGGNFAAL
jgi:hypothetical protein